MAYRIVRVSSRAKLELQMNYLVYRGEKETRIMLDEISVLIIENPQVCITCSLLSELLAHKVRVIICDNRHNPQGELEPLAGCFDAPSKLQKQILWKKETMDAVWQIIVKMKIANQAQCMRIHGSAPDRIEMMENYQSAVGPGDSDNREGQAARVYFLSIFGEGFDRRDQFDSRNGYLNYCYAILLSLINREIAAYGYSNLLGIHHHGPNNEFNLGCDFVEPFRPFVDDFVLSNKLNPDDFKKDLLGALTKECRCGEKTMIIQNAINSYVLSVLAALNNDKPSTILNVGFPDGRVGL